MDVLGQESIPVAYIRVIKDMYEGVRTRVSTLGAGGLIRLPY